MSKKEHSSSYVGKHFARGGDPAAASARAENDAEDTTARPGGENATAQASAQTADAPAAPDDAPTDADVNRSAALMSVLVIVSRITGFLRTWAQAYGMGTTIVA